MNDSLRFPSLSNEGRQMLQWLREHPHAPRYTANCGHRLTPAYLSRVQAYETELATTSVAWSPTAPPAWLPEFVARCFWEVPFYRQYGAPPANFLDTPTLDRADLSRAPWALVPDDLPLDDLILYTTSGTTGHPLTVLSHPIVSGCYTPLLKAALAKHGVHLHSGRGQVACILVGYQQRAYTYPSVSPQQDEAAHLKLNLHPDDWRHPTDRARFLDACNAELYTGDPVALAELMRLPLTTRPRALISTAMRLLPGLRQQLESHFKCPVLDMYSMNETGPLAVWHTSAHQLLQPRTFIEILDEAGQPCPPGARGEVTVTGGLNFFLPLLRYRTDDYARLEWRDGQPVLVDLEGRRPVLYRAASGQLINNLDITNALRPIALIQFAVHQSAEGAVQARVRGAPSVADETRAALQTLFGADQPLVVTHDDTLSDKAIQYTSDLPAFHPAQA